MSGQTASDKFQVEDKVKFDGYRKVFDQLRSTLNVLAPDFELPLTSKPLCSNQKGLIGALFVDSFF